MRLAMQRVPRRKLVPLCFAHDAKHNRPAECHDTNDANANENGLMVIKIFYFIKNYKYNSVLHVLTIV